MIAFDVLGTPAPKGSGRAIMVGGRARHVASGSDTNARRLKSWDVALREAARLAVGEVAAPPFVGVPLRMTVVFRMQRPAGHWGTGRHAGHLKPGAPMFPATKPDSSKLLRATEDSLIGIVFDDDSRIVDTHIVKVYAAPGDEGARITIDKLPATIAEAGQLSEAA